jgi:general secretion pathway protein A
VGQPDLEDLLSRRELRQVTQRVARRITLQPLSPREVQQYIEHRLRVARGDHREPADEVALPEGRDGAALDEAGVRFTPPAMRAIVMASGGLPRVINLLCQKALEIGSERGRRAIDHRVVAAAARDLNLPIASTVPGPRAVAATVAALAVLAAGTVWWWLSATPPTTAPASTSPPVPAAPPSAIGPPPPPQTAPSSVTSPAGPDAAVVTTAASAPASDAPSALTPRYTIAVASFRTAERAEEVAAQVGALDLPVFTRFDEASGWHQIVVGPYGATAEALTAQERLTSSGFPGTRITASNASPAAAIPITP